MYNTTKLITILYIILLLTSCGKNDVTQYSKINLTGSWKIIHTDSITVADSIVSTSKQEISQWFDAKIPSTVMGVLTSNGLYKDIFIGKNIADIDKSQFDKSWWYRTEFKTPALNDGQHVFLNFDGISYYANIWLNGKIIASRDSVYGTYRRFSFDIAQYIEDNNVLAVEVFRAQAGDPNVGFADWNPRPADENMGIYRDVSVTITGSTKLNNTHVKTKVNTTTLNEAWLTIDTEVENVSNESVSGTLTGQIESVSFSYPVTLAPYEKKKISLSSEHIKQLHIKDPRLWWCNNLGTPELYNLKLNFVSDNKISYQDSVTFGIRQVESYFTKEGYRGIKLNGKKVLLKSAGWTDDIFLRNSPQSNEIQVQYVKDMNMNMIRFENFWGTSQNIYDLCDKYGIMVLIGWSCQWEWEAYFGKPCDETYGCIINDNDINLIAKSFADQVLWLRNHPSIIGWMPGSDMLSTPKLEEKYLAFLKEADDRPYIGAAKERRSELSGRTGTKMAGPYEYVAPNYWYVDTQFGGSFGFNTETGIGAQLPVRESIEKFIPKDKLWPINEYWNFHCTTSTTAMNSLDILTEVMNNKYGKAKDLDDYLMKADLINYDGTRAMFEAFRVNLDKTTGIVQWMLNSAWPSLYWQLYDYYMIPTAAYYSVKKANEPIQLIYNYGNNSIYGVNETPTDLNNCTALISVYSIDSKLLYKKEVEVDLKSNISSQILKLEPLTENVFIDLQFINANKEPLSDNFYCVSAKQEKYDWDKTSWVYTPIKEYGNIKNLSQISKTNLDLEIERKSDELSIIYKIKVTNNSKSISFFNNFKLKDQDGNILYPIFWTDNYISILPLQYKEVECRIDKKSTDKNNFKLEITGWNTSKIEVNL